MKKPDKEVKSRTRQTRPTNKVIAGMLGITTGRFYSLLKRKIITRDMTVEEMRGAIDIGKSLFKPVYAPSPTTRTIRIDEEVYQGLKKHAEVFVDTPNTVLRRLLCLPPKEDING